MKKVNITLGTLRIFFCPNTEARLDRNFLKIPTGFRGCLKATESKILNHTSNTSKNSFREPKMGVYNRLHDSEKLYLYYFDVFSQKFLFKC